MNTEELQGLMNEMEQATEEERMGKVKELFPNFKIKYSKVDTVSNKYGNANRYRLTLENNGEKYNTTFTDSIYNTQCGEVSSKFHMLYCVVTDAQAYKGFTDHFDFMEEFGYEDVKTVRKVYEGCKSAYEGLERLVGQGGLEILDAVTYGF